MGSAPSMGLGILDLPERLRPDPDVELEPEGFGPGDECAQGGLNLAGLRQPERALADVGPAGDLGDGEALLEAALLEGVHELPHDGVLKNLKNPSRAKRLAREDPMHREVSGCAR